MDEWYYISQGAELGPVTWDVLKEMIAKDQLSRNALVKQGEGGRFILAKRVKGLVDLTSKPLILPGQNPPAKAPPPPPPPPPAPRPVQPTLSFTPAKPANEIALPPMALPPALQVAKPPAVLPQPAPAPVPTPVMPSAVTPPSPAAAPPVPPPTPQIKRTEIDDLLPPTAG